MPLVPIVRRAILGEVEILDGAIAELTRPSGEVESHFFTVMSVLSIFFFRKRDGWQKLPAVSFLYPLFPVLFAVVGIWLTYQGIVLRPWIALATFLTLLTGAAVYHFKLRQRTPEAPAVETY
mgnify:CR=1 FL=1